MGPYEIGTSVRCRGEFHNLAGALFDPSTVVFIIQKPDGNETLYTYGVDAAVIKEAVGIYCVWVLTDQVNRWAYRSRGTGAQSVARTKTFDVTGTVVLTP